MLITRSRIELGSRRDARSSDLQPKKLEMMLSAEKMPRLKRLRIVGRR